MAEKRSPETKKFSADWFMRGALARIGDSFDKLTGRDWSPSSSLTASELIERIKKLLDAEAVEVPGKGTVVPHEIRLKMQWDKFSDDADEALENLGHELLAAAIDHINDSLYYTYAPVTLEVKPDYFIEGVKLYVGFGKFGPEEEDVELNVTVAGLNIADALRSQPVTSGPGWQETAVLRFTINGVDQEKRLDFSPGGRRSVGRAASSDLVLDNDSVSKMHASLSIADDGVLSVADTGSTNGTFINGQRIAYGKAVALVDGDVLKFGQVEVRFERQPRTETVAAPPVEDPPAGDVVEIDGFEFKQRTSSDIPLAKTVEDPVSNAASAGKTNDGPADTE
jgi:pSer/pThr/pTyr-binding forkhead associated (FHA) protein